MPVPPKFSKARFVSNRSEWHFRVANPTRYLGANLDKVIIDLSSEQPGGEFSDSDLKIFGELQIAGYSVDMRKLWKPQIINENEQYAVIPSKGGPYDQSLDLLERLSNQIGAYSGTSLSDKPCDLSQLSSLETIDDHIRPYELRFPITQLMAARVWKMDPRLFDCLKLTNKEFLDQEQEKVRITQIEAMKKKFLSVPVNR